MALTFFFYSFEYFHLVLQYVFYSIVCLVKFLLKMGFLFCVRVKNFFFLNGDLAHFSQFSHRSGQFSEGIA